MNFENIEYLKYGKSRQQKAYTVLTSNQILQKLKPFDPILVGTLPINIDIEGSDLDIICCFADQNTFQKLITENFSQERNFSIRTLRLADSLSMVATFILEDFEIEIFGQNIPSKQQLAYRHVVIEYSLLRQYGEKFRQQIIELKRQGYKTEPAFALALGLSGDPYTELLKFENPDKKLYE